MGDEAGGSRRIGERSERASTVPQPTCVLHVCTIGIERPVSANTPSPYFWVRTCGCLDLELGRSPQRESLKNRKGHIFSSQTNANTREGERYET